MSRSKRIERERVQRKRRWERKCVLVDGELAGVDVTRITRVGAYCTNLGVNTPTSDDSSGMCSASNYCLMYIHLNGYNKRI